MSPFCPLVHSPGLEAAAADHGASAGARGLRGDHGADGSSPWERMDRPGRRFRHVGIACGPPARYDSLCVIDLAACFIEKGAPQLFGLR